jgi:hypothetical protein
MAVTYNAAWANLSLFGRGFNTSGSSHLQFFVHPDGHPWPAIAVDLTDEEDRPVRPVQLWHYVEPAGDGWYLAKIPLRDLGAEDRVIRGLEFREDAGAPQLTFYLDSIEFIPVKN